MENTKESSPSKGKKHKKRVRSQSQGSEVDCSNIQAINSASEEMDSSNEEMDSSNEEMDLPQNEINSNGCKKNSPTKDSSPSSKIRTQGSKSPDLEHAKSKTKKKNKKHQKSVSLDSQPCKTKVADYQVTAKQLVEDNEFFLKVLNMIPPRHYFDQDTNDEILAERTAVDSERLPGVKSKRGFNSEDRAPAKMKRAKYDPSVNRTVEQIISYCDPVKVPVNKQNKKPSHPSDLEGAALTTEAARLKLHQRLEELKKNRASLKDKGEIHRIKHRESKLKRKLRLQLVKSHKNTPKPINGKIPKDEAPKPIFNKEGKLVYSKFDFTDTAGKEEKGEFTGKNYQKLLQKVEKRNEKLKKLKETNPEKGKNLEEKIKWQSVLQRAEGKKVKDDPELLKRSLKAKEKKQKVRKKQWDERLDKTEKMKDDRQQKRQKNIRAQKQSNMERKVKKLKKKGRIVPGF